MNFTFTLIFCSSSKDMLRLRGRKKNTSVCPAPAHVLPSDLLCRPQDIASQKFSMPSPVRTVIAADFDNDNELEVFFNNIAYRGPSANRLFRCSLPHTRSTYSMYIVGRKGHKQLLVSLFIILKWASAAEQSWKVWARNAYLAWHPASSCHT